MQTLNHPNILRLHEVINEEWGDNLILIIDYAKHGEIMTWDDTTQKFISWAPEDNHFTEKEIQKLARDVIRGLDYLHRKQIVHRDLKPQNIMLDENGLAKIGDFGCAERFHGGNDTMSNTKGNYHVVH